MAGTERVLVTHNPRDQGCNKWTCPENETLDIQLDLKITESNADACTCSSCICSSCQLDVPKPKPKPQPSPQRGKCCKCQPVSSSKDACACTVCKCSSKTEPFKSFIKRAREIEARNSGKSFPTTPKIFYDQLNNPQFKNGCCQCSLLSGIDSKCELCVKLLESIQNSKMCGCEHPRLKKREPPKEVEQKEYKEYSEYSERSERSKHSEQKEQKETRELGVEVNMYGDEGEKVKSQPPSDNDYYVCPSDCPELCNMKLKSELGPTAPTTDIPGYEPTCQDCQMMIRVTSDYTPKKNECPCDTKSEQKVPAKPYPPNRCTCLSGKKDSGDAPAKKPAVEKVTHDMQTARVCVTEKGVSPKEPEVRKNNTVTQTKPVDAAEKGVISDEPPRSNTDCQTSVAAVERGFNADEPEVVSDICQCKGKASEIVLAKPDMFSQDQQTRYPEATRGMQTDRINTVDESASVKSSKLMYGDALMKKISRNVQTKDTKDKDSVCTCCVCTEQEIFRRSEQMDNPRLPQDCTALMWPQKGVPSPQNARMPQSCGALASPSPRNVRGPQDPRALAMTQSAKSPQNVRGPLDCEAMRQSIRMAKEGSFAWGRVSATADPEMVRMPQDPGALDVGGNEVEVDEVSLRSAEKASVSSKKSATSKRSSRLESVKESADADRPLLEERPSIAASIKSSCSEKKSTYSSLRDTVEPKSSSKGSKTDGEADGESSDSSCPSKCDCASDASVPKKESKRSEATSVKTSQLCPCPSSVTQKESAIATTPCDCPTCSQPTAITLKTDTVMLTATVRSTTVSCTGGGTPCASTADTITVEVTERVPPKSSSTSQRKKCLPICDSTYSKEKEIPPVLSLGSMRGKKADGCDCVVCSKGLGVQYTDIACDCPCPIGEAVEAPPPGMLIPPPPATPGAPVDPTCICVECVKGKGVQFTDMACDCPCDGPPSVAAVEKKDVACDCYSLKSVVSSLNKKSGPVSVCTSTSRCLSECPSGKSGLTATSSDPDDPALPCQIQPSVCSDPSCEVNREVPQKKSFECQTESVDDCPEDCWFRTPAETDDCDCCGESMQTAPEMLDDEYCQCLSEYPKDVFIECPIVRPSNTRSTCCSTSIVSSMSCCGGGRGGGGCCGSPGGCCADESSEGMARTIKDIVKHIECVCAQAEQQSLQGRQSCGGNADGLQVALMNLEDKCKLKDQMIEALSKELTLRANSKIFDDMMRNISSGTMTPSQTRDSERTLTCPSRSPQRLAPKKPSKTTQQRKFPTCICTQPSPLDISCLCGHSADHMQTDNCGCASSQLPIPDPSFLSDLCCSPRPIPRPTESHSTDCRTYPRPGAEHSDSLCFRPTRSASTGCLCDGEEVDPTPLAIEEIRRVSPDSVLVKWKPPESDRIVGYEIDVNGRLKSRVLSRGRNTAVLYMMDLSSPAEVKVFAMTRSGRCLPPATGTFP